MIIGVALVVDELRKGERLVFRYPPSVPSSVLNSRNSLLAKYHDDYLKISPQNFAKLFRPKPAFHNKILEISIEDLTFISFPCPCVDDISSESLDVITLFNVVIAVVRDSAMRKIASNMGNSLNNDPVASSLGLGGFVVDRESTCSVVESFSRALLHEEKKCRYVSRQVAQLLRIVESKGTYMKAAHSAGDLMIYGDASVPMSLPTTPLVSAAGSNGLSSSASNAASSALASPSASNTVTSTNSVESNHVAPSPDAPTNNVSYDLSVDIMEHFFHHSSLANELRSLYHGIEGGHSVNLTVNSLLTINIKLESMSFTSFTRQSSYMKSFDEYSSGMGLKKSISQSSICDSVSGTSTSASMSYRPYHSLLLVADLDSILVLLNTLDGPASACGSSFNPFLINISSSFMSSFALPSSSSSGNLQSMTSTMTSNQSLVTLLTSMTHPRIVDVVTHCNPTQSFIEISTFLDESIEEIYRIADHLQEWGLARVITTISKKSIYCVEKNYGLSNLTSTATAALSIAFCAAFGTAHGIDITRLYCPFLVSTDSNEFDTSSFLYGLLSIFDGQLCLGEVMNLLPKPLYPYTIDIIVWLLRRQVITEVNEYLFLHREAYHAWYESWTHQQEDVDIETNPDDVEVILTLESIFDHSNSVGWNDLLLNLNQNDEKLRELVNRYSFFEIYRLRDDLSNH